MIRLTNQNYCATIVKIKSTVKLDGLDNLVGAPLFGFTALIPKDYDLTKLYILFTAETQLSETYCHENNLFDKPDLNKDKSKKGYINSKRRVRAVKLKGNISSAFLMPIESLGYTGLDLSTLNEGDTFNYVDDEELCKKYVIRFQRTPGSGSSKQKQVRTRQLFNTKLFPEHIDTSHWARNSDKVSDDTYIYVSQKLHGSSFRLTNQKVIDFPKWLVKLYNKGYGKYRLVKWAERLFRKTSYQLLAGSRTVVKIRDTDQSGFYSTDIWNQALDRIGHLIPKNWAIYGELVGWAGQSPIQKNYTYECTPGTFDMYIYRIAIINEDGLSADLSFDAMKRWCHDNGLKICPEMWRGRKGDFKYEEYMDIRYVETKFPSCVNLSNRDTVDEGVVIRIDDGLTPSLYKAKSQKFLTHETKQLDDGVIDIESGEIQEGETSKFSTE